ncbi:MAG TPA: hypothetical protein VKM54_03715 [Myxococcota bacterium]|nr:hypothetical protein [Myxococcota bacterium]
MPTPSLYDALAARLHGWRKLAGLGFLVSLLLTALCIVAVRARLLSPVRMLVAGLVLLFSLSAWSAGVYLLCDWFDPEEGYLRSYSRPKPSVGRPPWIHSVILWISAIFLDVAFLGAAALTLSALYRAIS